MIFGIFGKFGIEIGDEKFFDLENIFRFLFAKIFRRKNLDEKKLITYFDSKFPKDSKNRTLKIIRAL